MSDPKHAGKLVFLTCPCGDGRMEMKTAMAIINAVVRIPVRAMFSAKSALANNFNEVWCACLNAVARGEPFTHFLMIHSDVIPVSDDWLTQMLDEMEACGADVLSAVIAIKDHQGLTSTAVCKAQPGDSWRKRRLTMTEVDTLPQTFNRESVCGTLGIDGTLLVNTGLLLIDLRRDWPMRKLFFQQQDRIVEREDGTLFTCFEPEDWDSAKQMERLGASVWATRRVVVHHKGDFEYPNVGGWGTYQKDPNGVREPGETEPEPRENVEMVVPID